MASPHILMYTTLLIVLQGVHCDILKLVNSTVAMEPLKVLSNYREVECIFGCRHDGNCAMTSFKMVDKHNYTGVCSYMGLAKLKNEETTTGVVLHKRE